ncbi:unnamed protein product [Linum trigynum]|uniref:Uncharacterized protein n=1 Tax=Linum trigynum TaxID=586398 RepID=A0AAV2E624_9ROSI
MVFPEQSKTLDFQGPTGNYKPRPPFVQPRPQFQVSNLQQQFQPQGGQGFQQQLDKFAKLEGLITTFVSTSSQKFEEIEKFMEVETNKLTSIEEALRNHQASLHNLETQIDNLVGILIERPKGALPSQTIANPKDQNGGLKNICLRSGKVTPEVVAKEKIEEKESPPKINEQELSDGEGEEAKKASPTPPQVAEYKPPIPFPTRVHKDHLEVECGKFMEMHKKLNITMSFLEAMEYMPS